MSSRGKAVRSVICSERGSASRAREPDPQTPQDESTGERRAFLAGEYLMPGDNLTEARVGGASPSGGSNWISSTSEALRMIPLAKRFPKIRSGSLPGVRMVRERLCFTRRLPCSAPTEISNGSSMAKKSSSRGPAFAPWMRRLRTRIAERTPAEAVVPVSTSAEVRFSLSNSTEKSGRNRRTSETAVACSLGFWLE